MTRRIRRRRKSSKMIYIGAAAFILLTIVALYFVKLSTRYAYENAELRQEMATVLNRLDGMDQSLTRINDFTDSFNDQTKDNVAKVAGKTGLSRTLRGETRDIDRQDLPEYSQIKLYDGSPLSRDQHFIHLLDRVNELTINANMIVHRLQGLKGIVASRREILSSVPSTFPAYGRLTSGFGYRKSPFTGKRAMHKGIDIAAEIGTPVVAPADGVVSYVGKGRTYGRTVVISHGYGIMTKFAHNSKILVRRGQKVSRGQIIAQIGNTGRSTGPHLHYEVWVNGKAVNPKRFLLDDETNQMLARLAFNKVRDDEKKSADDKVAVARAKKTPEKVKRNKSKTTVAAAELGEVNARNAELIARDLAAATLEDEVDSEGRATSPGRDAGMELAAKPLVDRDQLEAKAIADSDQEVASDYEFMEFAQVEDEARDQAGIGGDFESPLRLSGASRLNQMGSPEWEMYINLAIAAGIILLLGLFFGLMRREPSRR